MMLSVRIISDSALHEAKSKSEPKAFGKPEDCQSNVDFYAWHSKRDDEKDWFYGVWQAVRFPQADETPVENSDYGIVTLGRRHQLVDLLTEESIEEKSEAFMNLVISKLKLEEDYFLNVGVE